MLNPASVRVVLLFATALLVSGCASRARRPDRNEGPPPAPTAVKQGEAGFFADQVVALVTLAPAGHPLMPREGGSRPESGGAGARPSGPPPGGGGRGGEGRMPGGGAPAGGRGGRTGESMMPPARITLTLTNGSAAPIEVEIMAFDSALGNFAVRPERLRLEPGIATSPDPMTSRLGVSSADIPIKITLMREGVRETQTVLIRDLAPSPGGP